MNDFKKNVAARLNMPAKNRRNLFIYKQVIFPYSRHPGNRKVTMVLHYPVQKPHRQPEEIKPSFIAQTTLYGRRPAANVFE